METIKVLVKEPDHPPYVKEIENELPNMKAIVEGYIEFVTLSRTASLVCNEEGKLLGLPINVSLYEIDDIICGNFFICSVDNEGETISLSDADIEKYTKRFSQEI
jgi:hypothetical protein